MATSETTETARRTPREQECRIDAEARSAHVSRRSRYRPADTWSGHVPSILEDCRGSAAIIDRRGRPADPGARGPRRVRDGLVPDPRARRRACAGLLADRRRRRQRDLRLVLRLVAARHRLRHRSSGDARHLGSRRHQSRLGDFCPRGRAPLLAADRDRTVRSRPTTRRSSPAPPSPPSAPTSSHASSPDGSGPRSQVAGSSGSRATCSASRSDTCTSPSCSRSR